GRLPRFRAARNGPAGRRKRALGRERDFGVPLGFALRPHSEQEIGAGSRAVRRVGIAARRKAGRAASVLLAAGAVVPPRPLAGGPGARGGRDGCGPAAVSRVRKAYSGIPRRWRVHHSDRTGREAFAARPDLHDGVDAPEWFRFSLPELVCELRLS